MEHEIDAELREHMAMCIDDNMAQGMSREAAERDARRRFGNPTVMRERVSAEDAALGLDSLWHDLRSVTSEIRPDWDLKTSGLREAWNAGNLSSFHGWNKDPKAV